MTQAEKIAKKFRNDGQVFEIEGERIEDVCRSVATDVHAQNGSGPEWTYGEDGYTVRYMFEDGSMLLVSEGGWDFPLNVNQDCGCMECEKRHYCQDDSYV